MDLNPSQIYEKLVDLGESWAESHAAAELLEEGKKSLLSQLSTKCNEGSQAAKEASALRDPEFKRYLETMVEARRAANKAKVKYDSAKVWAELKRTEAANERATMRSA